MTAGSALTVGVPPCHDASSPMPDDARTDAMATGSPDPLRSRTPGCILFVFATLVLGFCVLPEVVFRLHYGRGPLAVDITRVEKWMTPAEVIELIGPPHKTYADPAVWIYFDDAFAFGYCGVRFGEDGLVESWWSH